jgi:CRISPR type III-B/RAMP module-associated protein Cmr5
MAKMENNIHALRAGMAIKEIEKVGDKKQYKIDVRKLPATIQNNGLIQTIAFCFAKGGTQQMLANQMHLYLRERGYAINGNFMHWLVKQDSMTILDCTYECMQYAYWLKRVSESLIKD